MASEKFLVIYVVDCTDKLKIFKSLLKMNKFVKDFKKKYPDNGMDSGCWIRYTITYMGVLTKFD